MPNIGRFTNSCILSFLGIISLCRSYSAAASMDTAPILKLEDAIRMAMDGNRQLQIAALEVKKAGQTTAEFQTARLPQLQTYILGGAALAPIDFTIPRSALGVYPGTGPIPGQDASVTTPRRMTALIYGRASQPVTQLYKIGLAIRESQIGEQSAREILRQKRVETASQVRAAYYRIVQTQCQIDSAEEALAFLRELSDQTDRYLTEETVLKADSLSVKSKLAQENYQLVALRNAMESQKESLNRLLGRDLSTQYAVERQTIFAPEEVDLSAARQRALEQRPEMGQARLQRAKAELEVKRERAEYLPDVSVQLTYLSLININFVPQNVATAGLLIEWQPFDWGKRRHRIEQLETTVKEAALTREDAAQQVFLDVNACYRKLAEARAQLESQQSLQEAEREKLRVIANRYGQKAALLSDILQQQSTLAQADSQYQQALANLWMARAEFSRALGEE
jgi:outer membrane protein TolC